VNPARAGGQALLAAGNRLGELEALYRVEVGARGHRAIVADQGTDEGLPRARQAARDPTVMQANLRRST
jgi:hypothetical protein